MMVSGVAMPNADMSNSITVVMIIPATMPATRPAPASFGRDSFVFSMLALPNALSCTVQFAMSRWKFIAYALLGATACAADLRRPVSDPYTGDLSIFEDRNRAKNLQ